MRRIIPGFGSLTLTSLVSEKQESFGELGVDSDETGESQAAKSWYVSPQATLSLTSRMPTAVNDYRKDWRYTLDISLGEQQVVNSQTSAIPAEQQKLHYAGTIQGTFEKEAWSLTLTVRDPQSTAGASPS